MRSLQGFSDAATPVFADLGKAAPALTDATRTLTPFSEATTVALKSLGATGEAVRPDLRAKPTRSSARRANWRRAASSPTTELAEALRQHRRRPSGWDGLVELIYNTTAAPQRLRPVRPLRPHAWSTLTNCLEYIDRAPAQSAAAARLQRAERQRRRPPAPARADALPPDRSEARRHRPAAPSPGRRSASARRPASATGRRRPAAKPAIAGAAEDRRHRAPSSTTSWAHEKSQRTYRESRAARSSSAR